MRKITFLFILTLFNTVALARLGFTPHNRSEDSGADLRGQSGHAGLLRAECRALDNNPEGRAVIESIASAIDVASSKYGVEPELLAAVIVTESRCKVDARSRAGAMGLMQLMPRTATWLGLERPFEAHPNIDAGAKYLAMLITKFEGNLELALAAYNAGPSRVKARRFQETREYVRKVKARYEGFRQQTREA